MQPFLPRRLRGSCFLPSTCHILDVNVLGDSFCKMSLVFGAFMKKRFCCSRESRVRQKPSPYVQLDMFDIFGKGSYCFGTFVGFDKNLVDEVLYVRSQEERPSHGS